MKKKYLPAFVLLMGVFMSCATRAPEILHIPERIPERVPETVVKPPSPMEQAIQLVRQNSPLIKKYFILDENRNIVVKSESFEIRNGNGEIEHFEVLYNMKDSDTGISPRFGYSIPFTLTSLETGESIQESFIWRPQQDSAGMLLSFDDNFMEVWERNFDLFDRYGAKVTFFVQGEYCSFCSEALKRGHDVGYHSLNHLNLPKVSRQEFYHETLSQTEVFRNAGVPLLSFAYPFGLSEPWMHEELLKSYRILRGYGVTFRVYNTAVIREGYISSRALDTILFKEETDFMAAVDEMLKTVKFIDGDMILPVTSHDISDTADWGIKPSRLEYLLETANNLRLNFYLFRDFID